MKKINPNSIFFTILFFAFASIIMFGNSGKHKPDINKRNTVAEYDSVKAKKLGADKYGMKRYVMAFLKSGPYVETDKEKATALQKAHMANIGRMANEGKLVLAGPFINGGEYRGIYIFNVETIEEAEALTNTDPAVQAGALIMELKMWYGSAALMEVTEIHNSIAEENP